MDEIEPPSLPLPLEGLYLHLVRAGFPLSVRDYHDLLAALRRGHGVGGRERLLWLCRALWARGDEELVRLQTLFDRFAPPDAATVRALSGLPDEAPTAATPTATTPTEPAADDAGTTATGHATAGFEFEAAGGSGDTLPSARHARAASRHYIFEPRPTLAPRLLALAWRRYRRAQRRGPKTELDIDATLAEQCRTGWLLGPMMVAPRRNQARLLVLMDASASMLPWRELGRLLGESLAQGRLGGARLLYFDNDPRAGAYDDEGLTRGVDLDAVLQAWPDAALLVVSDAGAARGRLDRPRIAGTHAFIAACHGRCTSMAWLNPMPRDRWQGSSAQRIARAADCPMSVFDEDGLVRAVDQMRGAA